MFFLSLGMVTFIGIHLLPTFSSLRQNIVSHLGEGPFKGIFSAIAMGGLILIIIGMINTEFRPIWDPPIWGKRVALVLMPLPFILLASANMKSNTKRFTRHPMLWGISLWSVVHLFANGDLASLILFGGLGSFSLFAMFSANIRGAEKQETKYPIKKDLMTVAVGLAAYSGFLLTHSFLFGVSII